MVGPLEISYSRQKLVELDAMLLFHIHYMAPVLLYSLMCFTYLHGLGILRDFICLVMPI